jgi:hypothetical protein
MYKFARKVQQLVRVARWYAYFQTKNTNLGKYLEGLAKEDVHRYMFIWYILRPFAIVYGIFPGYLVYFSHYGKL